MRGRFKRQPQVWRNYNLSWTDYLTVQQITFPNFRRFKGHSAYQRHRELDGGKACGSEEIKSSSDHAKLAIVPYIRSVGKKRELQFHDLRLALRSS